jgi:putative endonuclease
MPFFTYIIKSEEGFHYTGQSSNLSRRLEEHNENKSQYTKKGTNWKLIYWKEFETRSEAMKWEKWYEEIVDQRKYIV